MDNDLINDIEKRSHRFDAAQLVDILEEMRCGIFFEADPSLAFPSGDVISVMMNDERKRAAIRLSPLNILGSSSPLPLGFLDHVCRGGAGADAIADFLSITQNRLHRLWIAAHRKYSLWSDHGRPARRVFEMMTSRRADQLGDHDIFRLFAFSRRARSADDLKRIIGSIWRGISITITENIGRWTAVENHSPISGKARLGCGAILGSKVYDRSSTFRISLGPLDIDSYKSFLPNGENYRILTNIVDQYINEPLICELEVSCYKRDLDKARLGDKKGLGRTLTLGFRIGKPPLHGDRVNLIFDLLNKP